MWGGLGWVKFFLTDYGGFGKKIPLTRPMYTPKLLMIDSTPNSHSAW